MQKIKSLTFLFLASWLMLAHGNGIALAQGLTPEPPAGKADANADFLAIPLPDIEFDGSVLQNLPQNRAQNGGGLAPVKLIPPSAAIRPATPPTRRLTLIEPEAAPVVSPVAPKPVIPDAPLAVATPRIKPVITIQNAPAPPKAEAVIPPRKKEAMADDIRAEDILAAAPTKQQPPAPAAPQTPKAEIAKAGTEKNPAIVNFPVKTAQKTVGDLNPSRIITPLAPATPDSRTSKALGESMVPTKKAAAKGDWWQDDPAIIISQIPYPKPRPNKGMASESFVKDARKNLVETYTIVKREGDAMPSMRREKITNEKLPPTRLSIADIPDDLLASQIVDMSPQEVAQALNAMTPAAGQQNAHLVRELSGVAKPRIVREQGERFRKSDNKKGQSPVPSPIQDIALVKPPETPPARKPRHPAAGAEIASLPEKDSGITAETPVVLTYKGDETALSADATALLDRDVLGMLRDSPELKVKIVAFANTKDGKEATARRMSLSRALSVRAYLIAQGIEATRLDVRAMGLQPDKKQPADKVDVIVIQPKKT